ncbi:MAG TPA: polyhydroxyalkanoate synthesis regulator DNA-binding domain-containing protein [Oligoflexia bacterium]|nr:polyhydroxyalkanoate synthesis regulator DNA-binding domain-containing protein [Oligoflexia bacterium]HMR25450.1 polyhydroxyalkanoate synthesis regulator DNA-binding domain-containing protein [Oligoflexia bacterium]
MKNENTEQRIIKKYQNRKLYDTTESCYITLDDIANMVKRNEEVKVIDNKTKNDVTSVIFTQILVEQEKNTQSNLPKTLLRDLIRKGKGSIADFMHRYVVLGANSEEEQRLEAQKYIDQLVNNGELSKTEGKSLLKNVTTHNSIEDEFNEHLSQQVSRSVKELTHINEIEGHISTLNDKIKELESRLSKYENA